MELEKIILGSMILSPALKYMVRGLDQDVFCEPMHKIIFRHIKKVDAADAEINLVSLRGSLMESGEIESAGGVEYLVEVAEHGYYIEG